MRLNRSNDGSGIDHGGGEDADAECVRFLGALQAGVQAALVEPLMQESEGLEKNGELADTSRCGIYGSLLFLPGLPSPSWMKGLAGRVVCSRTV